MTETPLFSQFLGIVIALACGLAMAQERSTAAQESISQATTVKSVAVAVRTYNLPD